MSSTQTTPDDTILTSIFKSLSSVYNKIKHEFTPIEVSKDTFGKLKNLNEELGRLNYVINQKKIILMNALMAPVGIMVGGNLIGGSGGFIAPDKPSRAIYSTARIISNILKKYEKELIEILGDAQAEELQKQIIDVHKQEQDLFIKIAQMDELRNLLDTGDIDDMGVATIKELIKQARESHEEGNKKRQEAFNKIGNSLISVGMPIGHISFIR